MRKKFNPSRLLNDDSTFFGLNSVDLGLCLFALVMGSFFGGLIGMDWLSFPSLIVCGVTLMPIRSVQRRHIIRDFIFEKLLRGKYRRIHVTKNS